MSNKPVLYPCDLVFFRSRSLLSRLICFFTRQPWESSTKTSHVAMVVDRGELWDALIVEAVWKRVRKIALGRGYLNKQDEICIFRPLNIDVVTKAVICVKAQDYIGKRYSLFQLFLHFLDWCLFGIYVFRRLGGLENRVICSFIPTGCYEVGGLDFGVENYEAQPDDEWDYCVKHLGEYYQFVWQRGSMYFGR